MRYSFMRALGAATAFAAAAPITTAQAEPLKSANGFISFSPGGTFSSADGISREMANVTGEVSLSVIVEGGILAGTAGHLLARRCGRN